MNGTATLTISEPAGRMEHQESVSATGVTPGNRLFLSLEPTNDSDENAPEMIDLVSLSALPGSDSITVTATFAAPMSGPVKLNWSAF